jgi:hypothetical protein
MGPSKLLIRPTVYIRRLSVFCILYCTRLEAVEKNERTR